MVKYYWMCNNLRFITDFCYDQYNFRGLNMAEKKIKRFDFTKKPKNPSFLLSLAKGIISFPDLKKRNAKITRENMDELDGKPYLLLVTHSSMVDFNLMLKATHPYRVNNVMTLEGFKTYTEPLMRSLGVIGKRKYVSDVSLIRNIKYSLHTLKNIFVLFPEARYSLDGHTSYIPPSTAGLVRLMKVPVAVLAIRGNFITDPQWRKINVFNHVEAHMKQIITEQEAKTLSTDEIYKRILDAFEYDDYKWQLENNIKIDHPDRAKGLHRLLYKCPNCLAEHKTDSMGDTLWCNECGKRWRQDELGVLHAQSGETEFDGHIPAWSAWERKCVRDEVRDGTYRFEDDVMIETLPAATRFYKHGKGKLIQTTEGTTIIGNIYGKPTEIKKPALALESMHIEYDYLGHGDCVDISNIDDSFWCYLSKRDAVTKLSFATEEIYFLAQEKEAARKAALAAEKEKAKE